MSWLKRDRPPIKTDPKPARNEVPEGLWTKCDGCGEALFQTVLEENLWTCPKCDFHFRVPARSYLPILVDPGFVERDAGLVAGDPLEFRDAKMRYPDRLAAAQRETGMNDAVLAGDGTIEDKPVSLAIMDFFFMGGSMGSVVGEKVARTIERGLEQRRAVVIVSATGGARMQEGHLPFVSILTDPSTAGVLASYASLGDVILAEPGALVGFAGARVIRQTIGEELPPGFQRSEFVLDKGFIDRVVHRKNMRAELAHLLDLFWHSTRGFAADGRPSPHVYTPRAAAHGRPVP